MGVSANQLSEGFSIVGFSALFSMWFSAGFLVFSWLFLEVFRMAGGPIEFASDPVVDSKGPTEYGGRAGLVQGEGVSGVVGEIHELTASEKRGLIVRGEAVYVEDDVTGLVAVDAAADAVDPVTGLMVGPDVVEDGSVVDPVSAPPRTGAPGAPTV